MIGHFLIGSVTMLVGIVVGAVINDRDKKNDHVGDDTLPATEGAMQKVHTSIRKCGFSEPTTVDIIRSIQNAGILFRERKN